MANKTQTVKSLDRGLALLELLANSKGSLCLLDLVRKTQYPKSSIHSLLVTLQRRGYIQRNDRNGSYMFDLKLLGLADLAMNGLKLQDDATPFLRDLVKDTGLTVHMAVLERYEAVLVARVQAPGLFPLATWVGLRLGLHCTALGKAMMAFLPPSEVDEFRNSRRLARHNDNTICSWKRLDRELETTARQGYALDDEENEVGLRCVGAPIFGQDGRVIASVSVAGSTGQITSDNVRKLAELVKRMAASISESLAENSAAAKNSRWLPTATTSTAHQAATQSPLTGAEVPSPTCL